MRFISSGILADVAWPQGRVVSLTNAASQRMASSDREQRQSNREKSWCITILVTGWWYTYPSEEYEFVSWDHYSHYMENQKCSKPPTILVTIKIRYTVLMYTWAELNVGTGKMCVDIDERQLANCISLTFPTKQHRI